MLSNPKLKVCPVTRTAGQTAAVSLHTQQGGTVARRPTSEGAPAIKPARAHRTGALQVDELAIECITPNLRTGRRVVQFVVATAQRPSRPCLWHWAFWAFISFLLAFWAFISFHFGLLGLDFLSFWPFGPSFPFILAFWALIPFHFGLLGLHFLSFWPFGLGSARGATTSVARSAFEICIYIIALTPGVFGIRSFASRQAGAAQGQKKSAYIWRRAPP